MATKGLQCSIFIQNKLGDPEKAEALLEKGDADLVAVGTSALVNPDWANKVREGDPLKPFI
ncbi:hypothetical protein [Paenibacillus sp. PL2-23]|uniref:hypothetical protein n=1 Tax=Paenibacillus sp. PL2-23 TaxID=2100729 RepID=UPI0030FA9962